MALESKVEWYGNDKKKDMNLATIKALTRSSDLVQTDAKLKVPVDNGDLRSSIVTAVNEGKLDAVVSTNKEYAPYIEFGTGRFAEDGTGRKTPWTYFSEKYGWVTTSGHKAQPYMRPALNDNIDKIKKIFILEGSKAVDK